MTVDIINQTIRAMCLEVEAHEPVARNWQLIPEAELLYEATVCITGSRVAFEMALATADRLRERGLLRPAPRGQSIEALEKRFVEALSDPLPVPAPDKTQRWVRPRFRNRLASLFARTVIGIYGQSQTIRGFLSDAHSARRAREILTEHVWGFGPKQASLFLRRVGYCADLAILDAHVVDYLRLARNLSLAPGELGRLPRYEEIEDAFREVSAEFGHSIGCVDLATWVTMRVAKRESFV